MKRARREVKDNLELDETIIGAIAIAAFVMGSVSIFAVMNLVMNGCK